MTPATMIEEVVAIHDQVCATDGLGKQEGYVVFPSPPVERDSTRISESFHKHGPFFALVSEMGRRSLVLIAELEKLAAKSKLKACCQRCHSHGCFGHERGRGDSF